MELFLHEPISRSRFLKFSLKFLAITAFVLPGMNACGGAIPRLRGLKEDHYLSYKSLGEVFLQGNPIPDFDLGLAMDDYIYGHPTPIDTEDVLLLLGMIPSSRLAALALDFSFTPMTSLSVEDREKRLLSWKNSSLNLKRGAYSIMRQIAFFLVSKDKRIQKLAGYEV
ncbi:hypothetical protein CH379_000165 [Leptospira ellisii]|uniref:Uncharacterized protein n=1 Tax=Leptospira ellisii TaxID=2023197 RepID=A0A2N0BC19_9LEPT|nr:hypothetical protein [Leptospira ellisii]MDV6234048.1 hypothetical protein [Leptospira ellisii]PJZ94086.1 hypothetical protein CH379_04515 [Leptospira ellisii]PKA05753.1 hypothetical protein CH375_03455 [Leptospira ellisii]